MKKVMLAAIAAFFLIMGQAYAEVNMYITTDYAQGDEVAIFNLIASSDADQFNISGINVDIDWDETELSLTSFSNWASDYNLGDSAMGTGATTDNENGLISNFMWMNVISQGFMPLTSGSVTLGTFTFDVAEGAVIDGLTDFTMVEAASMPTYWFDEYDAEGNATAQYQTSSVATSALNHMTDVGTVPVPGAIWLLGSGLVGLAGISRRHA